MEIFALFALLLLAFGALMWMVPFHRWQLEHAGSRVEVRNYGLRERVLVNGALAEGSRTGGDYTTWASHRVSLASGEELDILIEMKGLSMICTASCGGQVIWTSGPRLPAASAAPAASAPAADPRQVASMVLLKELRTHPDLRVTQAGAQLEGALVSAFAQRAAALRAAEAHAALGASEDEIARLRDHQEQELASLLGAIRALHMVASSRADVQQLPDVQPILDELHQEQAAGDEVETAVRQARAAAAKQRQL